LRRWRVALYAVVDAFCKQLVFSLHITLKQEVKKSKEEMDKIGI
jgi:hypothetical protein